MAQTTTAGAAPPATSVMITQHRKRKCRLKLNTPAVQAGVREWLERKELVRKYDGSQESYEKYWKWEKK